jgi:hypothetical protein
MDYYTEIINYLRANSFTSNGKGKTSEVYDPKEIFCVEGLLIPYSHETVKVTQRKKFDGTPLDETNEFILSGFHHGIYRILFHPRHNIIIMAGLDNVYVVYYTIPDGNTPMSRLNFTIIDWIQDDICRDVRINTCTSALIVHKMYFDTEEDLILHVNHQYGSTSCLVKK